MKNLLFARNVPLHQVLMAKGLVRDSSDKKLTTHKSAGITERVSRLLNAISPRSVSYGSARERETERERKREDTRIFRSQHVANTPR